MPEPAGLSTAGPTTGQLVIGAAILFVASTEKLNEALAHLNEAAKERREELQTLLAEKYTDLKAAFGGAACSKSSSNSIVIVTVKAAPAMPAAPRAEPTFLQA